MINSSLPDKILGPIVLTGLKNNERMLSQYHAWRSLIILIFIQLCLFNVLVNFKIEGKLVESEF